MTKAGHRITQRYFVSERTSGAIEIMKFTNISFCVLILFLIFTFCLSKEISNEAISKVKNETSETASEAKAGPTTSIYNLDIDTQKIPNITVNPNLDKLDEKFAKCRGIDIREITISQIQEFYANGNLTAVELTKCYLTRIDRMNPVLKAVLEINPKSLEIAAELDKERSQGHIRSPLHGIPILVKDGIGTGDGMENTAGTLALLGIKPKSDAEVISHLRKAGAIILGKSNLSEMYWFRGTSLPNGWNSRGGQTRNAFNLNKTPEGSSSGSAVAVTANLCVVSVGTETDGSMIAPSCLAGVFAIKPTFDLVSVQGMIPLTRNQDHVGPIARTVKDLSILLDAMVPDTSRPKSQPKSYSDFVVQNKTSMLRIGVLRHPFWNNTLYNSTDLTNQLPQLEKMLELINATFSFELIDPVEVDDNSLFSKISTENETTMLYHDVKHYFNEYLQNDVVYTTTLNVFEGVGNGENLLASTRNNIISLKDLIQFYEEHPTPDGYNHDILNLCQATDGILNETYIQARDSLKATAKQLLVSVLERHNLDAIVTPSYFKFNELKDLPWKSFPGFAFSIAAIAGFPSINVPAGIGVNGVPIGITLIGKPYTEQILLEMASKLEMFDPQRQQPKFLAPL